MTPRKHAATIHAWADGAEIELFDDSTSEWEYTSCPGWFDDREYRVKPAAPKMRKVKMLAWFHHKQLCWYVEGFTPTTEGKRVPTASDTYIYERRSVRALKNSTLKTVQYVAGSEY